MSRGAEPTRAPWRGREVSRLEALSDAVFGFAITLLVVSLEVPHTATELFTAMRGFPAFAACFALLFLVWHYQYRFFRRYGLNDGPTVLLNAALLFVVLFFVYPLKFVFGIIVGWVAGGVGGPTVEPAQWPTLMVIFSAGYVAVFALFALMHLHAYRLRDVLELTPLERYDAVDSIRESLLNVAIGVLSVVFALSGLRAGPFLAGFIYWIVGPVMYVHGAWSERGRKRVRAAASNE